MSKKVHKQDHKIKNAIRFNKAVSKKRRVHDCPHPEKKSFDTRLDAVFECAKNSMFYVYPCKCGKWHLSTKKKYKRKEQT